MNFKFFLFLVPFFLLGCGGGGDAVDEPPIDVPVEPPIENPAVSDRLFGYVTDAFIVDGKVEGWTQGDFIHVTTVCIDSNENLVFDPEEKAVHASPDGYFEFSDLNALPKSLLASTHIMSFSRNISFSAMISPDSAGEVFIGPLSTAVYEAYFQNAVSNFSMDDAINYVAERFSMTPEQVVSNPETDQGLSVYQATHDNLYIFQSLN